MRRRVKREVGTIFGVVVILLGLIFFNDFLRRSTQAEEAIAWREALEKKRAEMGFDLLSWSTIVKTKGGFNSGPTFDEGLVPYDGQEVYIIGFQVPVEQFRNMETFILLPMPIECYFCQSPPMKDVVLVQMAAGQTAPLVKEPVLIRGKLTLNRGPKTKFFYTISNAAYDPPAPDVKLNRREVPIEHRLPHQKEEPLFEGQEPPTADPQRIRELLNSPAPTPDGPVTPPAEPAPAPETSPLPEASDAASPVVAPETPAAAEPVPAPETTPASEPAAGSAPATPETAPVEAAPAPTADPAAPEASPVPAQ